MPDKIRPPLRLHAIISGAVEEGVAMGVRRAFKHTDRPTEEALREHVEREVMNALDEVIDFGGDDAP
jgi:hypothetical protein